MVIKSEGNSQRANIRLDHMESDLHELKELAQKRNEMYSQEVKERNKMHVRLCEDVASLKTEVRIFSGIALAAVTAMIVSYLVG